MLLKARNSDVTSVYEVFVSPGSRRTAGIIASVGCLVVVFIYVGELIQVKTIASVGDTSRPYWSMSNASPTTQRQVRSLATSFGVDFDTRNRTEVLTEMRDRNLNPVPAVTIGGLFANQSLGARRSINLNELVPIGGISNSLTVLCNETGKYVTFETDEHGFRNPPGIWAEHRTDLAVVGESPAQGYCVPDGKTFVDLLRAEYPVTMNLAVSGESALLQLAAIREYMPRYTPKTVLWMYSEDNDIPDLFEEARQPLVMRYLDPDFTQNLASRQDEIDRVLRRFVADEEASLRSGPQQPAETPLIIEQGLSILKLWHLRGMLAVARAADEAQTLETLDKWHDYPYPEIIQQAQALTHSWGGTLYFVYLPSWRRYRHHAAATELEHATMLRMIQGLRIPYIDVQPAFNATSDPLSLFPFRRFGHYNEDGNRLVADTILHVLAKQTTD